MKNYIFLLGNDVEFTWTIDGISSGFNINNLFFFIYTSSKRLRVIPTQHSNKTFAFLLDARLVSVGKYSIECIEESSIGDIKARYNFSSIFAIVRSQDELSSVLGDDIIIHNHNDIYYQKTEVDDKIAKIPTPDVSGQISAHNQGLTSHTDIRDLIASKEDRVIKKSAYNRDFGIKADSVCRGNDARLSDDRPPIAHSHDDRYYSEAEIDSKFTQTSTGITKVQENLDVYKVDNADTWRIQTEMNVAYAAVINSNRNNITIANNAIEANHVIAIQHTDAAINTLVGLAPEELNSIWELAHVVAGNQDVIDILNLAITNKSDKGHTHSYLPTSGGTLTGPLIIDDSDITVKERKYRPDVGGHASNILILTKNDGSTYGRLGSLGLNENFIYLYLGAGNSYSNINLRIYPDGNIASNGFTKYNSSDSYFLLGGGGHVARSAYAPALHNHTASQITDLAQTVKEVKVDNAITADKATTLKTANWETKQVGTELVFYYNGTVIARLNPTSGFISEKDVQTNL